MTRRRTTFLVATVFVCLFVGTGTSTAQNNIKPCTTIQDGTLKAPIDAVLVTNEGVEVGEIRDPERTLSSGYDEYGYNYQGRNFVGFYKNWDRPERLEWMPWQWADDQLSMSWNDAWLSNKDCDGDGRLDRPDSYQGSGAVVSIHIGGTCGNLKQWQRQVEIAAVPRGAKIGADGLWSYKGNKLGRPLTIVFRDELSDVEWPDTGFVVTKDNFTNSCPTEGNHPDLFAVPLGPFESATFIQ